MSLPSTNTNRTNTRHSRSGAFTIIESLVLLAILAVMTMILIALARRHFLEPIPVEPKPSVNQEQTLPAEAKEVSTSAATE